MILRPRQGEFVNKCNAALDERGNTLGVAPTGAGKTIMLSAIGGKRLDRPNAGKMLVLQHRDELTAQNLTKFRRVNPGVSTSVVDADRKSWRGDAVFAMVPTLARETNLDRMPDDIGTLIVDECHHVAADSYVRIIDRARERNPEVRLLGVTATPRRGDGQALRKAFDNVGDQIEIGELIASGHLVPPRTFVIDVGVREELKKVRKKAVDFDMDEVARIMDHQIITDEVVRHWKEKAGDRQTVVFCPKVDHAAHVADVFRDEGITAELVHGDMPKADRRSVLRRYAAGEIQVITNCAVLTEGWDHPPTSCVILLRPSSYKSTFVQMVGRGLRVVDPDEHPGVIKNDCIVLDFGTASLTHGSLEQDAAKALEEKKKGDAPTKTCPECEAEVPLGAEECLLCGYVWELQEEEEEDAGGSGELDLDGDLANVVMTEIDLLAKSNFRWIDLFDNGQALFAGGFDAWAGVFHHEGAWYAVGGGNSGEIRRPRILNVGDRMVSIARGDDFLNQNETEEGAYKSRRWLNEPATDRQRQILGTSQLDFGLTKYHASCMINYRFSQQPIIDLIYSVGRQAA